MTFIGAKGINALTYLSLQNPLKASSADGVGAGKEFGRVCRGVIAGKTCAASEETVGKVLHIYHHRFYQPRRHLDEEEDYDVLV